MRFRLALMAVLVVVLVSAANAQAADYGIGVLTNVPVRMQDGVVLRADVRYPTDPRTGKPADGRFGVILGETPYGKEVASSPQLSLVADYEPALVRAGFISVIVDVRGTGASQGTWDVLQPIEAQDSVQVIRWAAKLPHTNGRVGMFGISYGGINQLFAAAAVGRGSPLKAIFPMMAGNDIYRELVTTGGLLNVESGPAYLGLVSGLNIVDPVIDGGSDPLDALALVAEHLGGTLTKTTPLAMNILSGGATSYDGSYWQARSPRALLQRVVADGIPAYIVEGHYDVYQQGDARTFAGLQNLWAGRPMAAPMTPTQPVTGSYQELLGPWYHVSVDQALVTRVALAWFDHFLNGDRNGIVDTGRPLHVIDVSGRRYDAARYPIAAKDTRSYYFGASGALALTVPSPGDNHIVFTAVSLPCTRETDQFAIGLLQTLAQMLGTNFPCDQTQLLPTMVPPGALSYETAPFTKPTALAGQAGLTLFASANTRDTEFVAHVYDVAPDGTATQLSYGALLGSARALDRSATWSAAVGRAIMPWHPYTQAASRPVTPGVVERYDIELAPAFTTLTPGHRLRVTVTTGDTPHLVPFPNDLPNLLGGIYDIRYGGVTASSVQFSFAPSVAASSAPAAVWPLR